VSEFEVFGCVDPSDSGRKQLGAVIFRDDAADNDGTGHAFGSESFDDIGNELHVASGKNRKSYDIDVFVPSNCSNLRWRETDALIDDFHAGITRCDGDLFSAIGVTVEARLAHKEPWRTAGHGLDSFSNGPKILRKFADACSGSNAGWGAIFAEDLTQCASPFARGSAGNCQCDGRAHDVLIGEGNAAQFGESGIDGSAVPCASPCLNLVDGLGFDCRVDAQD